jgi:hypothetical protein
VSNFDQIAGAKHWMLAVSYGRADAACHRRLHMRREDMDQGVRTRIIERYRWLFDRVTEELNREKIANLRICRSNSTWVITHLLTNDKIVGKTAHKTEWFLDRCAS